LTTPVGKLDYDPDHMCALQWKRIVCYDVVTGKALVIYDVEGGLGEDPMAFAREHFAFLHKDWQFHLDRHCSESGISGCLYLDARGAQRMEMLGLRKPRGPHASRSSIEVANADADLDAYVVHVDEPERFGGAQLKGLWNDISGRMRALLPSACEAMAAALEAAGVRERLYSVAARDVISDDMLVNNVGVSAAYQSPPHVDANDVGWTFAFACKCGKCEFAHGVGVKVEEYEVVKAEVCDASD
jgi:hypothetical protein